MLHSWLWDLRSSLSGLRSSTLLCASVILSFRDSSVTSLGKFIKGVDTNLALIRGGYFISGFSLGDVFGTNGSIFSIGKSGPKSNSGSANTASTALASRFSFGTTGSVKGASLEIPVKLWLAFIYVAVTASLTIPSPVGETM